MFGDEVNKLSDKKFKVDIFPASQLGTIAEMLQSVQAGSLTDVHGGAGLVLEPREADRCASRCRTWCLGREAESGARRGHRPEIAKYCEGAGFKVFGYWLLGSPAHRQQVRAVNKPDDCKGLKLRVINSQVYMQTFRALGANPVAMDPSELYLAMQQGVSTASSFRCRTRWRSKLYEVAKFVSLDAHTTDFFMVSTGPKNWTGFSTEEQEMINDAMKTAMDWQWKEQPEDINNALARAEDAAGGERNHRRRTRSCSSRRRCRCTSSSSGRSASPS